MMDVGVRRLLLHVCMVTVAALFIVSG